MRNLQALKLKAFKGLNFKSMETDVPEHQAQTCQNLEISRKPGALVKSPGYALATNVLGTNYTSTYKSVDDAGGTIGTIERIFEYYVPAQDDTLYIAQTDDDKLYYWSNTGKDWVQFDGNITNKYPAARFLQRGGVLIVPAGDDSDSYPIWYGYINREKDTDKNGYFGNGKEYVGYYCSKATPEKPVLNSDAVGNLTFDSVTQVTDAGDMDESAENRIMYRVSYVYDGFQESLMNDEMTDIVLSGSSTAAVNIVLAFDGTTFEDSGNDYYLNKRITGIKIYRAYLSKSTTWEDQVTKEDEDDIPAFRDEWLEWQQEKENEDPTSTTVFRVSDFYMLNFIDINQGTSIPYYEGYGAIVTKTLTDANLADDYAVNDKWNNFYVRISDISSNTEYIKITDSTTTTLTLADAPADGDDSYQYAIVSRWYADGDDYKINILDPFEDLSQFTNTYKTEVNHTANDIAPNYADAVYIHSRMFVGPVYFGGEEHKDWVMWSNISAAGAYVVDVFPATNVIKVSNVGIREVKRLGVLLDRLIIFGDTDIAILSIASGSVFGWELDETYQDVGLVASESLVSIDGKYYYLSADGVRVFDGNTSNLISAPIEDVDNFPFDVTTLSEAVAWYDQEKRQYIIHWPTDNTTYAYDLIFKEWLQPSYADEIDCVALTLDDEVITCDGTSIFEHNTGADHNSTNIVPSWKSKVYNMGAPDTEKILVDYYISYKSNTAVEFDIYVNRSSTAETLTNQTLAAATTETSAQEYFPIGTRGYEFEFAISLSSTNQGTNTYLEINEIVVRYRLEERA